jgi:hypothetical protein
MNQRHKIKFVLTAAGLAILLLAGTPPSAIAQSDNFDDGNDTSPVAWTHYSLPNIPPGLPPPYPTLPEPGYWGAATYSFPSDGNGGKAYRIFAPGITNDLIDAKNARAGSFVATPYSGRFSVAVDLLAWNAEWRQEAGVLFYFQDINLGTSDGYTATYSSAYQQLYISQINNEVPTTVAELGTGTVVLDPTHRYRLVASSHNGTTFLFQLFDLAQPNTPWTAAIGEDSMYSAGLSGLFVFEQTAPPSTQGADATFDNYAASTPGAGTLRATVTDVYPPPAGKATALYPTVTVGILNRDTSVDTSSIVLCLDGVWIPNSSLTLDSQVHRPRNGSFPQDFSGATVTYPITTLLAWGVAHTNVIAFQDNNGWQTNVWTWTLNYPYLHASNSLPIGSLSVRGFDVRMAQSDNGGVNLANSLARALQQLAIPPTIPLDRSATSIVQVLNWDKTQAPPNNVPGLCAGSYINIAVESLAYLELTAGVHRFHINTDDRSGLYSGASLADANAQALWENTGDTANATFDFVVEADGLYPVRCIWEETGGGAALNLKSVNLGDLSEVLVNDSSDPAGVVKAWYPLICRSAANVAGPYTVNAAAVNGLNKIDLTSADCSPTVVGQMVTGGTFTVPISGAAQFYRLDGPRQTKITDFSKSGSNVVITYQVQ